MATGATVAVVSDQFVPAEGVVDPGSARPEGLYVHIPFCVSICPYCDFVVYAGAAARGPRNRVAELLDGLERELQLRAEVLRGSEAGERPEALLGSVYVGGGTPSLLTAAQVERLIDLIDAELGIAADAEITLEANPGADEIGDLSGFAAAGATRLSIGAQSMDQDELRRLGRRHAPDDVVAAVDLARSAGIDSVGLDLLTDVPEQTVGSWRHTLEQALALEPDHLSVYALSLDDPDAEGLTGPRGDHLPVSPGARRWRDRARPGQSQERAAAMESVTDELAAAAGLERYEIANLARPGHRSRHNLLYWQRRPFLAIGPGAHSSDGAQRRSWNAARIDGYTAALAAGRLPPGGLETIDADLAVAERAMLGLRLTDGIEPVLADDVRIAPALAWAGEHGLIELVGGRSRLTAAGRLLADEVFVRLMPERSSQPAGPQQAETQPST